MDVRRGRRSSVEFDAESGDEVVWSRTDTPHNDDLMIRVRTTSTVPGLIPPIHLGGHVSVDCAMDENGGIALSQVQREGFEKLVFVLTQERSCRKMPQRMPVGNLNLSRLAAAHRLGLSQSRRELPKIREFLGLDPSGEAVGKW